ncbi:MAG: beta-ketoacyl-[acyl-carrier-protein] synthase family protein [Spirochaetes bacterium]|nr:beta-ketoacyl-[acyl-carrier-protein] synthase family protein [Spirochaetota bacterium]
MSPRVFITGTGIISPLGRGVEAHLDSLRRGRSGISPLTLFETAAGALPVGEITGFKIGGPVPRTHELAIEAARDAMGGSTEPPDAIIIGTTTGGMSATESLLKSGEDDPSLFRYHSTSSVAEYCAEIFGCRGLIITVTTACSSGAAAIRLAWELVRTGRARRVLTGGVDSLCRLTYYGFNALQLIDPAGARPLDRSRRGMSVGEGGAMLLLEGSGEAPHGATAEILGCGLSCDAHHPAAPHPEGEGAREAMRRAIDAAGLSPSDISYVNLHGTGTIDNDLAEARALRSLFGDALPPLSSTKGATGHTLAAAGAIEAVIGTLVLGRGFMPANTGCTEPDPELGIMPLLEPREGVVAAVLSNSFGFGGNNASLVLAGPGEGRTPAAGVPAFSLELLGSSCVTGAGNMEATLERLNDGKPCTGILPLAEVLKQLPPREIRRLKRLPRLALSLAIDARESAPEAPAPSALFFGTAWGPLSETHDFLTKLFESGEQFTSPTDFVGSVHNAPAGQAAILLGARGANITATGGDYSFEEALFAALLGAEPGEGLLVFGADEHHETLSPLFDPSVRIGDVPSDGGGALFLRKTAEPRGITIVPAFFGNPGIDPGWVDSLVESLGGTTAIRKTYGAVMAGMPSGERKACEEQLARLISAAGFEGPVIDYRALLGQYGAVSATAAALAARFVSHGPVPMSMTGTGGEVPAGKGILLLGLGRFVTAAGIIP